MAEENWAQRIHMYTKRVDSRKSANSSALALPKNGACIMYLRATTNSMPTVAYSSIINELAHLQ